jgi:hypothetical protein
MFCTFLGLRPRAPVTSFAFAPMANTLVCSIELSKIDGVTVTVKNDSGKITQTIVMNGTSITTTVKGEKSTTTITQDSESFLFKVAGPQETSTITQKQDQVLIKVKNFEVDAEDVKVKSSKDSLFEATGKTTIKSTGDMALNSSAKLTSTSTADMKLDSSAKLTASAVGDASVSGMNTTVEGSMKLVTKGGTSAELSAGKVDISGTMTAAIAAPITNVGKDLTTVKGSLVKVEGSLVKLG